MHWQYLAIVFLMFLFVPRISTGKEIGPEANFCAEINTLQPGDELVLRGGKYQGPCTIRRGGAPEAPVVIRAKNLSNPPWIIYRGESDNVINVRADYVTIRGLKIGPTKRDVDGIRIYARNGVTVEDCLFSELGGIAVVANHNSSRGVVVRRNIVTNTFATAMYFGCHDGSECKLSELLVENNYISGVSAPDPEIGYGIQVKLNSTAILRDNVVVRTKGPPIMVYGAHDANVNVIEGNFVAESRTSSGIVVAGGPAQVRNNISVHNNEAGIAVEDYAGRGLLRQIAIEHNTIYNNNQAGITVRSQREVDAVISKNAIAARPGTPIVATKQNGLKIFANQDCTAENCFTNPEERDFTPRPGSLLITSKVEEHRGSALARDYFGTRRPVRPTTGAVERPGGVVKLGVKR
jgi:parallel beta helix pectate lyase-like protein